MQTFQKPLTQKEEAHFLTLCKQGNQTARNILIEYNLRLVAHIAKKYFSPDRDKDDLISIGTIGLIKAIDTFDETKGSRLVTYASRCIDNELLMMLRQEKKRSREISIYEPIGTDREGNEINLMDVVGSNDDNILDAMIRRNHLELLPSKLDSCVTEREKKILIMRYGLNQTPPLTQRQVAAVMKISRSYVSRIEKKALAKLKHALETSSESF